jgi:hypothetical protein
MMIVRVGASGAFVGEKVESPTQPATIELAASTTHNALAIFMVGSPEDFVGAEIGLEHLLRILMLFHLGYMVMTTIAWFDCPSTATPERRLDVQKMQATANRVRNSQRRAYQGLGSSA